MTTPRPAHRPRTLIGGRARSVYMSDADYATARALGDGSVAAGIRVALDTRRDYNEAELDLIRRGKDAEAKSAWHARKDG